MYKEFTEYIDNTTEKLYNKIVIVNINGEDAMNVHNYKTTGGKDLILDYIMNLSKLEIIDGLSVLEYFEKDELDKLSIKQWQGKVWEVYFYKHNRIFYVAINNTDAYMLHACRKQKNKTEKSDSEIVKKRAKELSKSLSVNIL
jgi:phage-related protein